MRVGDDVGPVPPGPGERWSLADLPSDVRVDAWRGGRRDPPAGREVVEQDGRQVELRAGEFAVWDSTRPARFRVAEPLHKRTLLVPRARLAALHPGFSPLVVSRPRNATLAALFSAYVASVASCAPSLDDSAALAAGNAALELLAGALVGAAATGRGALGLGTVAAVDRAIDRQLGDQDLSPGRLAAQHGISVRTLHLLFEQRGETVSARIRRLRLAKARADLADPRAGSITEIALRWGFRDPTQFSRAFRRAFDQSPRDARAAVAPALAQSTDEAAM